MYSPETYSLFDDLTIEEYIRIVIKIYDLDDEGYEVYKELLILFELKNKRNRMLYSLSNEIKKSFTYCSFDWERQI